MEVRKVKYFRYSTPLSKLCCFAFSNSRPLEPHSPNFLVRAKGVENYQYISCFFVQIIPHIWYNSCRSICIQYATNIDNCRMANVRFWRLPRKQMITIAFEGGHCDFLHEKYGMPLWCLRTPVLYHFQRIKISPFRYDNRQAIVAILDMPICTRFYACTSNFTYRFFAALVICPPSKCL